MDGQLIVSVTRYCAFTRNLATSRQKPRLACVLWCKTGIFAQFYKPFAKYTALRQLLAGVKYIRKLISFDLTFGCAPNMFYVFFL